MDDFSRNKEKNKNPKLLSLMQTFGLIFFIFSGIVFACIVTDGFFGTYLGKEILNFILGVLGYSAYAFFAAFTYAGLAMFLGKKPSIKKGKVVLAICLFIVISLIVQMATSNRNELNYGNYLSDTYYRGVGSENGTPYQGGLPSSTFGGVIFGIIAFPFFRLLTPIVAYIIFSLTALILMFFLFGFYKRIKERKPKEYFSKPELNIKGEKFYNLDLPESAAAPEKDQSVSEAPKKLFVADIGDFTSKAAKKPASKGKAYDLLIGGQKPQQESSNTLAYSSTLNSKDILFKKPDISKSLGKELFNSENSYVDSFDKSIEEKKKYILTPPDPAASFAAELGIVSKKQKAESDRNMPNKYIHDKIDTEKPKKKKYTVLDNQMTAYDLYTENSEYDDVEYGYDEVNKIRRDDIISDATGFKSLNDYGDKSSGKSIFDQNKKFKLLNDDRPEIISDNNPFRESFADNKTETKFESKPNENKFKVNERKFTVQSVPDTDQNTDAFFSKIQTESEDEILKSDYIEYPPYNAPPMDLLNDPKYDPDDIIEDYDEKAALLEQTLEDFKINAKVINITPGSSVTRYELQMPPGMPVSRILSRSDDIAMALSSVGDVRIEAPIPGKSLLGIEIPNSKRKLVVIKEVLNTKEFFESKSRLSFALGKDIGGKNHIVDIAKMPHLLIAGATGSGKSVCLNALLISILYKCAPEDVRIILIDPKRVEFNMYANLPHLLIKNIINEQEKAIAALNWAIAEMENRFEMFNKRNAKDIDSYNERIDKTIENKLPRILIVVDELAELMSSKKADEVEEKIQRLAQLSRAAGIHLVLATQRPSVDVITGLIKANMPSRIAFRVISQIDSRTIMDVSGAEKLLGDGDMIFTSANTPKPMRLQCPFISLEEIENVLEYTKNNNEAYFDEKISDNILAAKQTSSVSGSFTGDDTDPYLLDVLKLAIESNQISISMVQRRFAVGYARAGKIIDDLERQGLISALDGSKPRQVLISMDEYNQRFGR